MKDIIESAHGLALPVTSLVLGCGASLPETIVSNDELAGRMDTSDAWIRRRTGIGARRIAEEGQLTSQLATCAARAALRDSLVAVDDLDFIILATTTPDRTFPACATAVQAELGMKQGFAFDIQAVCAGFIYALATADGLLRSGQAQTGLVIGAETFTRLLDWEDRGTAVLFGDGAGALVLAGCCETETGEGDARPTNGAINGVNRRGILSTRLYSDGQYGDLLYVDGGPSLNQTVGHVRMNGPELFRHAVSKLASSAADLLSHHKLTIDDIDWYIPHQANQRIIEAVARKLGLHDDRIILTVERHANTSAASIPLALAEAAADGRLQKGQLLLIGAIGGGLTWGSSLIRW